MKRIVVKVGTAVVSRSDGKLALGRLGSLVEQLCELADAGHQVLLVSSGAVGLGAARLGIPRPTELADRQAAAATGQGSLIALYDGLFRRQGRYCAQVLLTEVDFHHRAHYLNLASALERLLQLGVVPVINENDVVSTVELALTGRVFGDNDRLGALVASNLGADLLVLLSDVDAVYTAPPGSPGAERIAVWSESARFEAGDPSRAGTGGIQSKVAAARIATRAGVEAVISSGLTDDCIWRVVRGDDVGTRFPAAAGMNRRRQWIAFATVPAGVLTVNEGARAALVDRGASLLWPGVTAVEGDFEAGAVVEVACGGQTVARGVVGLSSEALRAGLGGKDRGTVLHRNDIAMLEGL
ncbi:MAG: glutamate 5-kinase [Myxococcota bacterium]